MNPPSLPTDNLYKFLALAGLVLFVVAVAYPWLKSRELSDLLIGSRAVTEREGIQIAALAQTLASLDKQITLAELLAAEAVKTGKKGETLTEARERRAALVNAREALDQIRLQTTESGAQVERNKLLLEDVTLFRGLSRIGAAFGLLLSICGFALWYFRVQRYQDAILKKQAAQS